MLSDGAFARASADNINPDGTFPTIPATYTDATGPGTYYLFAAGEGLSSATYQPEWVRSTPV